MRLQTKRKIDEFAGYPILFVLNYAALLLGLLLRRSHRVEPVERVLVLKFQGMGSLVLAKPALVALRRAYPRARLVFWGSPGTVILAREMPEFDEFVLLDDRNLLRALASVAGGLFHHWRHRPDWAFDLEVYSKLSSILMTVSCPRNRAGFAIDTIKHRQWTHTHLIYFNRYRYLGEAYAKLIGLAMPGSEIADTSIYGPYRFNPDPLPEAQPPYVVVNIHAGELSLERRWPREYFEVLIRALLDHCPDLTAVLIGHGEAEVRESGRIPAHPRLTDLSGTLDLRQTVRLLANARLVVSNDTAPLHLALSTGVPLIGIFGPTRASTYFPKGRTDAVALSEDFFCSPCIHHWEPIPCGGDNQCLKSLSVRRVLDACCSLLGVTAPALPEGGVPDFTRPEYYAGLVSNRYLPRPGSPSDAAKDSRSASRNGR